jgi:ADP-dependent NAD(P)H-hydrate dehydratase / NAD(P)H-hydrate epimerase
MNIVTAGQMAAIDRETIKHGTPGIELMQNAGDAVFEFVRSTGGVHRDFYIPIVAGTGNNGGDGHRAAYRLAHNGYRTAILLVGLKDQVTGDAGTCLKEAESIGVVVEEIDTEAKIVDLVGTLDIADIIVDALFGTGFHGDVEGLPALVIDAVNAANASVVSIDVPSGVDGSTGAAGTHAVRADATVTFGSVMAGHVIRPGRDLSGDVSLADIGFPLEIVLAEPPYARTLVAEEAAVLVHDRRHDAHKNSVGRTLLVAGSVGMTGAAALASRAVLKVGAGVSVIACPAGVNDILEVKCTEVMTIPLPDVARKRCLALRALGGLREIARDADVVAVGPGLGTYHETMEVVRRFVGAFEGRIVLDADGITAFAGAPELLKASPAEIVITPHPGECARLMGVPSKDVTADPIGSARAAAEATGAVVLLKGSPTVIVAGDGPVWINGTGNDGMATAGMGDVLTGTITGFAAQGLELADAALLGAYIHGLAGDITVDITGVHGLIAGDVLDALPSALKETLNARDTGAYEE